MTAAEQVFDANTTILQSSTYVKCGEDCAELWLIFLVLLENDCTDKVSELSN